MTTTPIPTSFRDAVDAYVAVHASSSSTTDERVQAGRALEAASVGASDAEMLAAFESTMADPDGRAELRWELYEIAEVRPCRWMGEVPVALVESVCGYERYTLARAIAASGHPRRAERYAALARRSSPFVGCAYSVLVTIPDAEIFTAELPRIADAARREHVVGSLARRLLELVDEGTLAHDAVRAAADPLTHAYRGLVLSETLAPADPNAASSAGIVRALLEKVGIALPELQRVDGATPPVDVFARIEERLRAAWPLRPGEEAALAQDLQDSVAARASDLPFGDHWINVMWRRFAMPLCNPWFLHVRVGLEGESFNAVHFSQGRLACTAFSVVAGFVAAEEVARDARVKLGPPREDLFDLKNSRSLVPEAQERFLEAVSDLGPVLLEGPLGPWAKTFCDERLAELHAANPASWGVAACERARAGFARGLAVGALLWSLAFGWRGGALAALAESAEAKARGGSPRSTA